MPDKIFYHGTNIGFVPPFKKQFTWLACSYDYAYNHASVSHDLKPLVLTCKLKKDVKLFDPRKFNHLEQLRVVLPKVLSLKVYGNDFMVMNRIAFLRQLTLFTNDVWRLLECNLIFKSIQSIGFQGHISKEDDEDTICIYDPENIEILEFIEQMNWKDYSEGY